MFWGSQLDELTPLKKCFEPQRRNCKYLSSSEIQQCGSGMSRGFNSDVETIEQRRNMYRSPDKEEA